jgi:hypothetical protein
MTGTTYVVQRKSFWDTYRWHGYFFREAAMLTIGLGVVMHVYRVIFGDALTMQYVVTPTTDKILLIPMTYAAITGILLLVQHRVQFANTPHRALFTGSVVYIAGSVPLHIYLQLHHLGHDVDDVVPGVVQLVPADRRVPGVPDSVPEN